MAPGPFLWQHAREDQGVFTVSDVVDAVQVALTLLVVHVLAFGPQNLDGVMAEENLTGGPADEPILKCFSSERSCIPKKGPILEYNL